MRNYLVIGGFAVLVACGVPPSEEISSKADFKPLGTSYFAPVDASELEQSQAWSDLVDSYN